MARQNQRPLNRLESELPEGILVDAAWLHKRGYSRQLLSHYVRTGWLQQPVRGVYQRPRGALTWQQLIVSLQMYLEYPLAIGGRTALELLGYAHYLTRNELRVHLHGPKAPPAWLTKLKVDAHFIYHSDKRLFTNHPVAPELKKLVDSENDPKDRLSRSLTELPVKLWDWRLVLSTPERALLELLDELPSNETFHQVDMLMQGLANLSPRRLEKLLADCKSVKVKRLFFYFADRHQHKWLEPLKRKTFDLGSGKRLLVKGGKLDPTYQITVPEDLNAL